ncbi:MAG TPA: deoxyribose-phosphate aldolase [Polyangiaceae bacterium]
MLKFADVAKSIDHSLLGPALTVRELEAGCRLALHYDVASICILPYYLPRCAELVAGSTVRASTTIGFPHGGHATSIKVAETLRALDDGADELDVVVNISKVMSGDWDYVRSELSAITQAVHSRDRKIKVIFENSYLGPDEKAALCAIAGEIGADWAKTSTGFGPGGATMDDVKLMRGQCPPSVGIKASGGIRDIDEVLAFRALGATRIGTSRSREILEEWRRRRAASTR